MKRVFWVVLGIVVLAGARARASERHFPYTYESAVLPAGKWELEPSNTFRLGKADYFAELDTRLEAELGLSDRLQTSLYLNLSSRTADTADGRVSTSAIEGLSSEWKLKLADPVADPIGFALYGEASFGTTALELEGKLIADKRAGRLLAALNASAEHEWEFDEPGETARETTLEVSGAVGYFLTRSISAGFELRSHTVIPQGAAPTRSALFLGPSFSVTREGWWVAVSVLPQLHALAGASKGGLDLVEHERIEARFLFGLEF